MKKVSILNCIIDDINVGELLENFKTGVCVPVNVDMIVKMQKDNFFYDCCHNADIRVNDSQIVRACSYLLGTPLKETISGSDLFPLFYKHYRSDPSIIIFLLGAMPGVAEKAMENINYKVNRKMVVCTYSPPFGFEKNEQECLKIIKLINESKATVLAIGLGAPKQEKWVFKYKDQLSNVKRILCIGATIDFEAGNIDRAPKWIRKIGFEWFFRLVKEPKRLWKRYLIDDIPFLLLILKQKLGFYKNPFEEFNNDIQS
jgi:N-acetylglucosaminyldiphosphoundecaprenol N-acetyl-beta-D-mannosaminyltransferase